MAPSSVPQVNILGLPAVVVPGGYFENGKPFSLIFIGRKWSEAELLSFAYDYEQAAHHPNFLILESVPFNDGRM